MHFPHMSKAGPAWLVSWFLPKTCASEALQAADEDTELADRESYDLDYAKVLRLLGKEVPDDAVDCGDLWGDKCGTEDNKRLQTKIQKNYKKVQKATKPTKSYKRVGPSGIQICVPVGSRRGGSDPFVAFCRFCSFLYLFVVFL